jgi:intein-encoded DNA endonuclease-like protein
MSPELAYIIAVLQGDGCVNKNYFSLETIDKDFGDYFAIKIEKWTGYKPSFYVNKPRIRKMDNKIYIGQKTYKIVFNGRRFTEFLLKNFTFGTTNWHVPEQIINGTKDIKIAYLRGIFDSEGSVGIYKNKYSRNYCYFNISSKNINALKKIKELLQTLNFTSVIYSQKNGVFRLEIKKVHEIVRFYKEVGTSIERKQKAFEKIIEHYKNSRKYTIGDFYKVFNLKEKGFGSRKISKLTKIPRTTIIHWLRGERLPRILRYEYSPRSKILPKEKSEKNSYLRFKVLLFMLLFIIIGCL